jgi:hypothetical protein
LILIGIFPCREQVSSIKLDHDTRFTSLDNDLQLIIRRLLGNEEDIQKKTVKRSELVILNSIRFKTMESRRENIADAHRQTFEWIFKDPVEHQKPWSSFCKWLESGSGIYWIQGHPGTGKSTLMSYIVEDSRTTQHLKIWVPSGSLSVPSFFFWNSGDLRSLTLSRTWIYPVSKLKRDRSMMWLMSLTDLRRRSISAIANNGFEMVSLFKAHTGLAYFSLLIGTQHS